MLPPPPPPMSNIPRGPGATEPTLAKSSTWSYRPGFGNPANLVPMGSGERIRPERVNRRGLNSLTHFDYEELGSRPASQNTASAMTIADVSPRLALQRLLMLYENGDHREAAAFLRRLAPSTFKQLLPQLPADLFIESMPHSLPILEALYAKLFLAGEKIWQETRATSSLRPEAVVWQMVRFFASQEDGLIGQMRWEFCGPFISSCKRLLSVLLSSEPRVRRILSERKKSLQKAIEGLGQHGMVGTSDEKLMNLHDALKLEFHKVQKSYSDALDKLDSLALIVGKVSVKGQVSGHGKAPIAQSHQRQLSLKADEIQERLIKNKTLLNVVEPTLENTPLEVLLGILQQRIELDKECMFQFTQLRKEVRAVDGQTSIAPVLMRYQRGCQQVLELMKEVADEGEDEGHTSDLSPYQSDSDSAVMMSGNSPFISKAQRYNFLSRSVRLGSKHNVRASILASSLSEVNLELHSSRASTSTGPPSFVLHSSSGVSSGSASSDTASNEDKCDSPTPSATPSCGSSNTVKRRPESRTTPRPRHLKPKKDIYKSSAGSTSGTLKGHPVCSKCEEVQDEPVYQGILEVTKPSRLDHDSSANALKKEAEVSSLKADVARLNVELAKAKQTVEALQDKEDDLKEQLVTEKKKKKSAENLAKNGTLSAFDKRPAALVRKYGELYAQTRLETLDSLDKLKELDNHDDLKSKLLFSVIVLSFRSVSATVETKREQVRRILQLPPSSSPHEMEPAARELETALTAYLRRATETFDLSKNVEEVCTQIWATLYDYPGLKSCDGLIKYIKECVRTAWGLTNQIPAYCIEYETRNYRADLHVRFHSSNTACDNINTYLWPSLLEGTAGPCVQKGVVIT